MTDTVAAAELRAFVERIEAEQERKDESTERQKGVYDEAGSRGYDTKVLRKVVADRKKDRDALAEERAVQEMYENALEGHENG